MRLLAVLGVLLAGLVDPSPAQADDVLKPYVVLMLDTSGSMTDNATGAGAPTCGGVDNRLNHARCAINKIVNSYGDMVFALGRFRETTGGSVGSGQSCDANGDTEGGGADQCTTSGVSCNNCNCNGRTTNCSTDPDCTASLRSDARGEMLTGLVNGGNQAAATWTDFSCGTCAGQGASLSSQPEIWGTGSWTPLGGFLASAARYWLGLQASDGSTIWPSSSQGFDPIRNDPTKLAFLPTGCDPSPSCVTNCCASQCRPYITIMLTDGDETCGGNAVPVAQGMLDSVVDGRAYRIETKVIGFGVTPGDDDIEAYAHAGGAPDLPGAYEGYYANDEASLQLALSQILADAVKSESCNNLDDDCDGNVDEDFLPPNSIPGKGGSCSNGQLGICARTGSFECRADGAGLQCNAPAVTPGVEALPCNGLDDDCDGKIDEGLGCTQCVPTGEICDGNDNDCDGVADQVCRCSNDSAVRCDTASDCGGNSCDCTPITRPCGTGTCAGIETCTAPNTFTGCTAPPATAEICDGIDNDCDGLCDGFQLECSEVVSTCNAGSSNSCPGTDNPGHPSNNPIPQNVCRPGTRTCPLDVNCSPGNSFGICSGEVKPCTGPDCDICNGLDDDCDNVIDEDFAPADCSTNCGMGMTQCVNGAVTCNSTPASSDTDCDNNDDDCDGEIDEDWQCPDANADQICDECTMNASGDPVCMGEPRCINGVVECVGGPVSNETCNCLDDNCNGQTDEGALCPGGSACVNCQCAFACTAGEFPCPLGKKCETTPTIGGTAESSCVDVVDNDGDGTVNDGCNYCVNDPCFGVSCPPVNGNLQTCVPRPGFPNEPQCTDVCALIADSDLTTFPPCAAGFVCVGSAGECRPDNCTTFPDRCTGTEVCVNGTCMSNPCAGVTCAEGQYCLGGACVASCADITCPDGQRCRQGACETDPCGAPCPYGQACNDATGECITDPCTFRECPDGQWCNPGSGSCEDDPCVASNVTCPDPSEVCRGGTCIDEESLRPDAGEGTYLTVGGGGGCTTHGGSGPGVVLGLALLLALRRRRERTHGGSL